MYSSRQFDEKPNESVLPVSFLHGCGLPENFIDCSIAAAATDRVLGGRDRSAPGTIKLIDLDLSRYDGIASASSRSSARVRHF